MSDPQSAETRSAPPYSIELTDDPGRLAGIVPQWEELARRAIEPNPMYEHWMLLPAIRLREAEQEELVCALVWTAAGELAGLFPFKRVRRYKGVPVSALVSWTRKSWMLGTPLVRADQARACVTALFDWLEARGDASSLIEWRCLPSDGAFEGVLADALRERRVTVVAGRHFTRPILRVAPTAERYLEVALSQVGQRGLRRKEKRLGQRGEVRAVSLQPGDDPWPWIDDYLRLEAAGWKGRQGVALTSTRNAALFACQTLMAAHQRNRLHISGIDLDGKPVARSCTLVCGEGAYALRTAYDEQLRTLSPGLMAEVRLVHELHAMRGLQWADCIGDADDITRGRMWSARRTVRSLVVGAGTWGEMWVSMLPLMRWTKRAVTATGDALVRSGRSLARLAS